MSLPLRSIAVFHAVARCGSLSKAAAELCVTPSAVSHQIHALELHLGTTLLARAGRGIVLTEAGERYFEMIAEEVDRIGEATQRIRGFRSRSVLTARHAHAVDPMAAAAPARFSRRPSRRRTAAERHDRADRLLT
jgi:LysR family transcriptional regulator, glycine cleavage system transcriptional activator